MSIILMIYDVLMDLCVFKCVTCFLLMSFHDIINSRFVSRRSKARGFLLCHCPIAVNHQAFPANVHQLAATSLCFKPVVFLGSVAHLLEKYRGKNTLW